MPRSRLSCGLGSAQRPYICRRCLGFQRIAPPSRTIHATSDSEKKWKSQAQDIVSGKRQSMLAILEERGYIKDIAGSRTSLDHLLTHKRIGAYAGIDPTAPSLHLGHLLPFMILFWLYIHGHHAVSLIGGATAKIGDPSGRLSSRKDMDKGTRVTNLTAMRMQVDSLWANVATLAEAHGYKKDSAWKRYILDNSAWLDRLTVVDFLAVLGRGARMGTMMGRDTVKNKMTKGDGMSYAEFTYPLLQAWDWWHMYKTAGVQIQIGGSDQYGNVVAGMDAIKFIAAESDIDPMKAPYGITTPLLTTSSGAKFGKSAGNAVWLDKDMTTPFDLYGFLLRSSDADVKKYLSLFTFLPLPHINQVMHQHLADPTKRLAQHLLARQVVDLVHGSKIGSETETQHRLFRRPTLATLTAQDQSSTAAAAAASSSSSSSSSSTSANAAPTSSAERIILPRSLVINTPISRILWHARLAPTKSAASRLIQANGAYIGIANSAMTTTTTEEDDKKTTTIKPDAQEIVFRPLSTATGETINSIIQQTGLLILRMGKWKVRVVEVVEDADYDPARGLDDDEAAAAAAPGWADFKATRDQAEQVKGLFSASSSSSSSSSSSKKKGGDQEADTNVRDLVKDADNPKWMSEEDMFRKVNR